MGFEARILADSISPDGHRLTTMECTYPRCIHSEFMTHRIFSRNAASSRAIPVSKMLDRVEQHPFVPIHWGTNQRGMQAGSVLSPEAQNKCEQLWLDARDFAVLTVQRLADLKLHKQIANRLLEPWMWITVIVSATEWENFFKLRCHPDAEPHIQKLAYMMRDEYDKSNPASVKYGQWHRPLTGFPGDEQLPGEDLNKVSVARCARVSYLTHDGKRNVSADLDLYTRLESSGHFSPFEHVATPMEGRWGNLTGWKQIRKYLPNENCTKREI